MEEFTYPDPATARVYESGVLLPGPTAELGGPTLEEWVGATALSPA